MTRTPPAATPPGAAWPTPGPAAQHPLGAATRSLVVHANPTPCTPRHGAHPARLGLHTPKGARYGLALLLIVLFVIPVLALMVQSGAPGWRWPDLWPTRFAPHAFAHLHAAWPRMLLHLASSTGYALLVTLLTFILCVAPARALAFGHVRGGPVLEGLLLAPALLPAMSFALGLHETLVRVGLADTLPAVVLVLATVSYPYMLRALMAGWLTVGEDYRACAANLGADALTILWRVELPLLMPAAVAGGSIVFLVAFSDYFLVYLVGGGNIPSFTGYLFPVLQSDDRALGALLTLLFMMVPLALFAITERLVARLSLRLQPHH